MRPCIAHQVRDSVAREHRYRVDASRRPKIHIVFRSLSQNLGEDWFEFIERQLLFAVLDVIGLKNSPIWP